MQMGRRCCTLTRRLSSVRSTATPASTLPTVNDTNIVKLLRCSRVSECLRADHITALPTMEASWSCRKHWRAVIGTGSAAANFEPAVYIARSSKFGSIAILPLATSNTPIPLQAQCHTSLQFRSLRSNCYTKYIMWISEHLPYVPLRPPEAAGNMACKLPLASLLRCLLAARATRGFLALSFLSFESLFKLLFFPLALSGQRRVAIVGGSV